MKQIGQLQAKP